MSDDRVDLMHDRLQTDEVLKSFLEGFVPLPVAAATTFHQAHGNSKAIVSRQDYDDALNIAAAALSRLIPIYLIRDPLEGRIALAFDLTKQHFARGATELRFHGGTAPLRDLSIRRSDLLSALSLIKRNGKRTRCRSRLSLDLRQTRSASCRYGGCMEIPLQISFHGVQHSEALASTIRDKARGLDRYYDRIMSCRVVLELAGRHQHQGKEFVAKIELKVPGGDIAVTHQHSEDPQVA
jgi:ribosome-associated translation inhibitor RaiA